MAKVKKQPKKSKPKPRPRRTEQSNPPPAGTEAPASEQPATGAGVRPPPPKKTGKRGPRPLDAATDDVPVKGEPLQADLPGMEDREIAELESAAEHYARIRDRRMELNKEEVNLKTSLLSLMHIHEKEEYNRDGISIKVVHEEESVKVRVKKDEE